MGDNFGVLEDDVAPEVEAFSVDVCEGLEFDDEIKVNAAEAELLDLGLGLSLAQFPRFVAAGVELGGIEEGEELAIELGEEFDGSGVQGVEGGTAGIAEVAGELGELAIGGKGEDALEVAEGCEGGTREMWSLAQWAWRSWSSPAVKREYPWPMRGWRSKEKVFPM